MPQRVYLLKTSGIALNILIMAIAAVSGCDNRAVSTGNTSVSHDPLSAVKRLPMVKSVETWEDRDGLIITTEHYTIHTTLKDPLLLRILPTFVESAYEGYQSQLPRRIPTGSTFDIYLFAAREQWEAFTDEFVGEESPIYRQIVKGAYCANGACVAYYIGRNETFSAIGHEGWHQFSSRHFVYRLPSWLDEGIATLFESGSLKDGQWVFDPQMNLSRLGGLKRTMLNNNNIPLRNLVALNPGQVIGGQEGTVAFYSQSHALVRFLREDGYGRRLGQYHALLLGGLKGDWPLHKELREITADRNIRLTVDWNAYMGPALFEYYISPDWQQMEQEYLNFCRKITYHVLLRQAAMTGTKQAD